MDLSSPLMLRVLLGSVLATACAPDAAAPGYEDPFLTSVADPNPSSAPAAMAPGGETATAAVPAPPSTSATAAPSASPASSKQTTSSSKCDLSGRWLVTQRTVEEGLGVQQALRHWMYFEFSETGQDVTAMRGLDCGWDVVPLSAIAGAADLHKAWPKITENESMAGRKATVRTSSSGCSISFAPYVSVYGATAAYYKDTSRAMPGPNEKASDTTPGWEDWDSDGNPGITYNLSGIATGQVFYASRQVNTWSGSVGQIGSGFRLALVPRDDNNQLGYNGSPLLTTQSNVSANASLHFVEFARLDETRATGDDTATCNAVRTLAPMLTPKADEKPVQ